MIKSFSRGHVIIYDGTDWRYVDNGEIVDDKRKCSRCGKEPTKKGYDACLGYVPEASSACCGHGVVQAYIVKK